jgi:hypothetical protein
MIESGNYSRSGRIGRFVESPVAGEIVRAFVPPPLPPEPAIDILTLLPFVSSADRAVGRLDGIAVLLPRPELFLYMYVRKEAVLSSQIEGTQSTLSDILRFETEAQGGQPIDDIREVSNYVDAMMYGLERLGAAVVASANSRNACAVTEKRTLRNQKPQRISPDSKLGGRDPTRQRTVRTPAGRGIGCLP